MIESIDLKNFQSHQNSHLDFCEGVNTIIGTSDSGKSSIYRAFNLVCNNKPEGNAFVSDWLMNDDFKLEGNTDCEIKFDDCQIRRVKGKVNEYYVDETLLTAFGKDVPEAVVEKHRLNSTNLQHQSDNFFLLNLPSSKVAEELNKIVNLEVIDKSVQNVNAKVRHLNQEYKISRENIENNE